MGIEERGMPALEQPARPLAWMVSLYRNVQQRPVLTGLSMLFPILVVFAGPLGLGDLFLRCRRLVASR